MSKIQLDLSGFFTSLKGEPITERPETDDLGQLTGKKETADTMGQTLAGAAIVHEIPETKPDDSIRLNDLAVELYQNGKVEITESDRKLLWSVVEKSKSINHMAKRQLYDKLDKPSPLPERV